MQSILKQEIKMKTEQIKQTEKRKTKCITCGKKFVNIYMHDCKRSAKFKKDLEKVYDVESIDEFFDNVKKFMEKRGVLVEFYDYPSNFSDTAFDENMPGWSGNFKGRIRVIDEDINQNFGFSDLFSWFDSIFHGVESGSGASGKNFSLSRARVDLRVFPKLFKKWEAKGKLEKKYKQDYIDSIIEAKKLFHNDRNRFVQYHHEIKEINRTITNIKKLLKESEILLKNKVDALEKEYNEKHPIDLPNPNDVDSLTYKEIQKLTHIIPSFDNANLDLEFEKITKLYDKYLEYVKNNPQYLI
jgi:hypothetical protein